MTETQKTFVLIVDGNPVFRAMLKTLLKSRPDERHSFEATNVNDAVDALAKHAVEA